MENGGQSVPDFEKIASKIRRISTFKENWPKPTPLPLLDISVPPLAEDLVPDAVKIWVGDITNRMQVSPEFVMAPLIVGLSSIVGRKVGLYPKAEDTWIVIPNLWGAIIARPGFFKSPILAEVFKPIAELARTAAADFERAAKKERVSEEIRKARIDAIKEAVRKAAKKGQELEIAACQEELERLKEEEERTVVKQKRYITNDATVEKLALILMENPNGILFLRDELYGWLRSLNKLGREGDREFYLESWNGYGSYTVDRIGRGTIHIPALCLSLFGGLQPGKLEQYVASAMQGGEEDDGLLQRFQIMVYPDLTMNWKNVDTRPDPKVYEKIRFIFQSLDNLSLDDLNPVFRDNQSTIPGIEFDREGQDLFNAWRCQLENRLRSGKINCPAFESHLAKYRSLVPSLALIFYLIDFQFGTNGTSTNKGKIGAYHSDMAIRWCDYLETHARKIYGRALEPEIPAAQALLEKIQQGKVADGDHIRTIYRHHWSLLDSTKKLDGAIAVLERHGWVRVEIRRTGARSSEHLRINPFI
jgi:hypothetical protein